MDTLADITLSERALTRLRDLLQAQKDTKFRVFITGGGCSGFQYGFTLDEIIAEDDIAIECNGVTMLVDSLSYQYLTGSQVDYEENLAGARFIVNNPAAKSTCGCGASFSI